jgi:SAM-dependent methyltransferase
VQPRVKSSMVRGPSCETSPMADSPESSLDETNRPLWAKVAAEFVTEGWGDPGEVEALLLAADRERGRPVLDLGVGGGRTTSLLRLVSPDYVGIDYTPELVELCRHRHPDADIRLGDARDLSGIDDGSQSLVVFSNNGIDAVNHDGRNRILSEVHRVLKPGATFYYSTLNKDGPLYHAHPGNAPGVTWVNGSFVPYSAPYDGPGAVKSPDDDGAAFRAIRNWRQLREQSRDEGEWGLAPFAAHEFGLVTHFVTLGGAESELDRHGFDLVAVVPCDRPEQLGPGEPTTALYVHLIAERR